MKKLLFYVMSVITIAAFSNCKECQTPQASNSTATPKPNSSLDTPTVVEPRHVPNQCPRVTRARLKH